MSIYMNMTYAPLYYGIKGKQNLDRIVQENLEVTAPWDEVKDELSKSALDLLLKTGRLRATLRT